MTKRIILNVPHASIEGVWNRENGWQINIPLLQRKVNKWTDWFTDFLFSSADPNVIMKRCPLSRFVVDVERLVDDPLEEKGQGIIYTEFEGIGRAISEKREKELIAYYHLYQKDLGALITDDHDVLIDCHSFPSYMAPHVDICIGFNEDWSKPSAHFLKNVQDILGKYHIKSEFNHPFSNSITPESRYEYSSFMLEINKRCYMDERLMTLNYTNSLQAAIEELYTYILSR